MRPKTKMQKEIVGLSRNLPEITRTQIEYAFKHCFTHFSYRTKNGVVNDCMECGHRWESKTPQVDSVHGCTCPKCGEKLQTKDTRLRTYKASNYFCILTTCRQYQVVRYFYISKKCKVGESAKFQIREVVQRWVSPQGHVETRARLRAPFCYYSDVWSLDSSMELRRNYYNIPAQCLYNRKKIIPELKRNGFTGDFYGITPVDLFTAILNDSKKETLLKSGQTPMLRYSINANLKIDTYWQSIKICIRNGYIIEDASLWTDYIDLLMYFGKDTNNAKYVCPKNLKQEHDRFLEKKRKIVVREELKRKIEDAIKSEALYVEQKGRFFGLSFTDGEILVKVIESVVEFAEEGIAMHHCVFDNKYYLKEGSLILSATIEGKRIETVEVSLDTMKVVQSRGVCNSDTEYHKRIVDLVNKNIHLIQKVA